MKEGGIPTSITTDNEEILQSLGVGRGYWLTIRDWGSFTAPPTTPSNLVEHVISLLVPRTAHNSYHIVAMDSKLFLLRMDLMQLTERVHYLDKERDSMEMRTLLV